VAAAGLAGAGAAYETEQGRRRSVERAVAEGEGGVREDATPWLADEGGADEAGGVGRRETEEDLGDGVVDQLGWRRHGRVRVVAACLAGCSSSFCMHTPSRRSYGTPPVAAADSNRRRFPTERKGPTRRDSEIAPDVSSVIKRQPCRGTKCRKRTQRTVEQCCRCKHQRGHKGIR
jgi:hypothetical protein